MQLTEQQYKSLKKAIYNSIMGLTMHCECGEECTLGMGEMGETTDEADRVVDEWMELNKLTLKED
jgi:hypothetical protein